MYEYILNLCTHRCTYVSAYEIVQLISHKITLVCKNLTIWYRIAKSTTYAHKDICMYLCVCVHAYACNMRSLCT